MSEALSGTAFAEQLRGLGVRSSPSRAGRSLSMSRHGMVASSHLLATQAGLEVLQAGGTAADSAVCTAAVLAVVEPAMTGLGGDAFFLYYDSSSQQVHGYNGSGRSPAGLTEGYFSFGRKPRQIDPHSWLAVTVPGGVDAWCALLERFGRFDLKRLLPPAIEYAEHGFPVTEVVGEVWRHNQAALLRDPNARATFLRDDQAPPTGSVFANPHLAESLGTLASGGRDAFYCGPIARAISNYSEQTGGFLRMEDFEQHQGEWVDPIATTYRDHQVLQLPPNGQGLTTLMLLRLLQGFDLASLEVSAAERIHLLVEAKKLAYADAERHICDPAFAAIPIDTLLSEEYTHRRRALIDTGRAARAATPGLEPTARGDTVYLTVVDKDGNAVSFIHSLFEAFGSRIVAGDTGILLQNRGAGFTLEAGHANRYQPRKRPFHTIIPGMVLKNDRLMMSYGLMGGSMQPQGHAQFLSARLDHGLNIQQAADLPRWRHTEGRQLLLEDGLHPGQAASLEALGHHTSPGSYLLFGGAQAIEVDSETGVRMGASDPRKDGGALGY